jgi:phenylacetate-CoA ligase
MFSRLARYGQGIRLALGPEISRDEILAFQARRLRQLVRHCFERVPYYRDLFQRTGLHPDQIRGLDDLSRIPLTARADLQFLEPKNICAAGVDPESLLVRRTSGSSGAPLTVRRRWFEERLLLALRLRTGRRLGVNCREARVVIDQLSTGKGRKMGLQNTAWQNRLGIFPKFFLNWQLPIDELVRQIQEVGPATIAGPPSVLSWVADELTPQHRECIRPRFVGIGGESHTPAMGRQIERGFGAPLLEFYGSHEFVLIAVRLPDHDEFQVFGEAVIVELLREDGTPAGPGEEGELVGTALHSFAMPFLRYRLADLVRRASSDDAHPLSCLRLSRIVGRTVDRFVLAGGRYVHPYVVARLLRDEERWLRRFQLIQCERNRLRVRIVPYIEPDAAALEAARRKVQAVFPEPVDVDIELVTELPPTSTGKFYPYVSLERYRSWGEKPAPPV